jgi:ADP-ribosyl-[dinitrogen reductase] hydrolase
VALTRDLGAINDFGAAGVVTLIDERELMLLRVDTLPLELSRAGIWWKHLPIADMGIPDRAFERRWEDEGPGIHGALARGENVIVHCWAGLGRTGTIAARLLVESGMEPAAAILRVRDARPGAIQTRKQEKYVLKLRPLGA